MSKLQAILSDPTNATMIDIKRMAEELLASRMNYQVLQDGKPADNTGYPTIHGWPNSKFKTYEEAKFYALCWALPMSVEDIKENMMEIDIPINRPVDLSSCGPHMPVMMEIREI